jgi:hypothetical protein
MGGETIPGRLIIIEPNGNKIFINCNKIPHVDGGDLEINGVQVLNDPVHGYDYLEFPPGAPGPKTANDLEINLKGNIVMGHPGDLPMPYNGGTPLPPFQIICIPVTK